MIIELTAQQAAEVNAAPAYHRVFRYSAGDEMSLKDYYEMKAKAKEYAALQARAAHIARRRAAVEEMEAAIDEDTLLGSAETENTAGGQDLTAFGGTNTSSTGWTGGAVTANYTGGVDGRDFAVTYDTSGASNVLNYTWEDDDGTTHGGSVAFDATTYTSGDTVVITDGLEVSFDTSATFNGGESFTVSTDLSGTLNVSSHDNASNTISKIDSAIQTIADELGSLGDKQSRLSFKQDNLQTSMTNYEAARSRIEDADFAKEQMEIVKLQILQQTGTAALAQANSAPQAVLSLF